MVSFPDVSAPKHCMHLSSLPYVLQVPPISLLLIRSPGNSLVRSTYLKAPRYVVFSTSLLFHSSCAQISSSEKLFSNTLSLRFLLQYETQIFTPIQKKAKLWFSNILNSHSATTAGVVPFLETSNVWFDVLNFL